MCFCISLASQKVPNVQFSILHLKGFETIILIFSFMFCIEGPCLLSKVHLSMSLTFSEKMEKFRMIVDFESQILALFDTSSLHCNSQNSMISFGYVDSQAKIFLILGNIGSGYYLVISFEAKIEILSPSFLFFYIAPGNSSISKVRH